MKGITRPELFLIPSETCNAVSREEVEATFRDMVELDIAYLPYSKTDIGINADDMFMDNEHWNWEAGDEIFVQCENDKVIDVMVKLGSNGKSTSLLKTLRLNGHDKAAEDMQKQGEHFGKILIVLLATKNVVKKRVENKLARLGIGKKHGRHLYTTTITIPPVETLRTGKGMSGPVRPHLRRGHIRRQRWGPKRAFLKRMWIEPCFINADENFISSRTAYNTSVTFPLIPTKAKEYA